MSTASAIRADFLRSIFNRPRATGDTSDRILLGLAGLLIYWKLPPLCLFVFLEADWT